MRPSVALTNNRDFVVAAVGRYRMVNPRTFGSVARGEDTEGSDLDLLVDTLPETSMFDLIGLQTELESRLSVGVDVVAAGGLHWLIRDDIIAEARMI